MILTLNTYTTSPAVKPADAAAKLVTWREGLTLRFTWLYQLQKVATLVFMLFVMLRYGKLRLGSKKDRPEYTTPTYFCMLFAAGVGESLLGNGVSEPSYYQTDHFFANTGYRSQDETDMFAVNTSVSNWGIGSWISITLVAVCMSLAGYRFNLPMTFRSCFYPILGAYTWGWMGDMIDTLAIVAITACTCAMLGATAILGTTGLIQLGLVSGDQSPQELASIQSVTIWIITIISTLSVISGLRGGIQYVPLVAMFVLLLLTSLVLVMDDTKFLVRCLESRVFHR
jgi:betaine/carnitine transporter, BCCT family